MAEKDQNRNQHRAWMLTVPADRYGEADLQRLLGTDRYSFIGQLERGKEKTPLNPDGYLHWQLYLQSATSSAVQLRAANCLPFDDAGIGDGHPRRPA